MVWSSDVILAIADSYRRAGGLPVLHQAIDEARADMASGVVVRSLSFEGSAGQFQIAASPGERLEMLAKVQRVLEGGPADETVRGSFAARRIRT
jgi:hypothetical protein